MLNLHGARVVVAAMMVGCGTGLEEPDLRGTCTGTSTSPLEYGVGEGPSPKGVDEAQDSGNICYLGRHDTCGPRLYKYCHLSGDFTYCATPTAKIVYQRDEATGRNRLTCVYLNRT